MTLRLPIQYDDDARTLRMSISIKFRWKWLEMILTVENNDEEATLTIESNMGVFELGPRGSWAYTFSGGGAAVATMESIAITKVVVGGKELFAHQCKLHVDSKVSKTAMFDAKTDTFFENLEKLTEAVKSAKAS
ncbi:hypothetical protein PINS_up011021 [Pythium insidiosum]|nr:hypothetical protein PINS_up011021 [Pythium insidiosum]